MKKLLMMVLPLVSTTVLAHPGHLSGETLHGFLHAEHIITLAAVGIIVFVVSLLRGK